MNIFLRTGCGLAVASVLLAPSARSDSTSEGQREAHVLVSGTDIGAVEQIARQASAPFGMVRDSDVKPCQINPVTVDVTDMAGALQAIMRQCPRYMLGHAGESLFLGPTRPTPDILRLRIPQFSLTDVNLLDAKSALMRLPEVKDWLKQNRISPIEVETFGSSLSKLKAFSLQLKDVEFHDVLDAIARASGRMLWMVQWAGHDASIDIEI